MILLFLIHKLERAVQASIASECRDEPSGTEGEHLASYHWRSSALAFAGYAVAAIGLTWPLVTGLASLIPRSQFLPAFFWQSMLLREVLSGRQPWVSMYETKLAFWPVGGLVPMGGWAHMIPAALPAEVIHPLAAFNLTVIAGLALAGLFTFWLVRYLVKNQLAAWIAGLVFLLHPYQLSGLTCGQADKLGILFAPLVIFSWLRLIDGRSRWSALWLIVSFCLLSFSEPAYGGVIPLFLGALSARALWRTRASAVVIRRIGAGALCFVPVFAVLYLYYVPFSKIGTCQAGIDGECVIFPFANRWNCPGKVDS